VYPVVFGWIIGNSLPSSTINPPKEEGKETEVFWAIVFLVVSGFCLFYSGRLIARSEKMRPDKAWDWELEYVIKNRRFLRARNKACFWTAVAVIMVGITAVLTILKL
jgi:hypothetical protein